VCQSLYGASKEPALYEDALWHVRHAAPAGVPGWMLLITKRNVGGPAHFDDREARSFGPALRHFERVTGALRIYTAAMGESHPHFHAHMVPRYAAMRRDAKAFPRTPRWSVLEHRGERSGDQHALEITVDRRRRRCLQTGLVCRVQRLGPELCDELGAQRGDPAFLAAFLVPHFGDGHGGFLGMGTKLVDLGT
jgi:diadenosine tetraphosphate (Ap4A) HIT family hydrolase